ncbi:MAG TPA: DUF1800 domain-containing protein [Candidatus Angelobacter sp.]|nr:DUF1800 domain-containing protein [Candidatus Angelobacter sp.]
MSKDKWNYEMAAHLLNRAGFGGPPADIQKLADLSQDQAISSLLDYENIADSTLDPDWAHPNPDEVKQLRESLKNAATPEEKRQIQQAANRLTQTRFLELRGWWLQRMARGPRPFQEKMVLFWHGHFATSSEKVRNPYFMWRQNELFRRLATSNWELLLNEAGKDPAMLVWLDQAQSRKEHPNENFAREVMELFALGEGHYTEHDVTEAARALTGWSLDQDTQKFIYRPRIHDDGQKTFLGRNGDLDGDEVIATIVEQPQAAKFITAKIWNYFAGQVPDEKLNAALANVLRANGNNFKPFLRVMLRSEEFYSDDIVRNQVKSPVQWLIGSVRMLECDLPPTLVSWGMLRQLGQDIFAPPNVKGWDGGVTWITTNTLLTRYNDAQSLVMGTLPPLHASDLATKQGGTNGNRMEKALQRVRMGGVNIEKILPPEERSDKEAIVASLQNRLFQTALQASQQEALQQFLDSKTKMSDADIAEAIRLMMSTPEYQVT